LTLHTSVRADVRILIVKLSSLGDVVHAMAAVQDIRRALPAARIDWVVERAFAPLVSRCEGVQRVIPVDLRSWRRRPLAPQTRIQWRAFKTELQQTAYDAVIDLQGLTKSAWIAWLANKAAGGLHFSLGNRTDGSSFEAPARWLADRAVTLEKHVHAVQRSRLLCAAALGYTVQGAPDFGLRPGTEVPSHAPDPAARTVLLVHGTSRADKEWPADHWIALGQRLNAAGYRVALPQANAHELRVSESIAASLSDATVWPPMTLDVLVDSMAACAGVIGVDSGLSHIAVALGLPHVQLYNFDTAWRTGVENDRQVSVFATPYASTDSVWSAWLRVTGRS